MLQSYKTISGQVRYWDSDKLVLSVLKRLKDKGLLKAYYNSTPNYALAWLRLEATKKHNLYKLAAQLRQWGYGNRRK